MTFFSPSSLTALPTELQSPSQETTVLQRIANLSNFYCGAGESRTPVYAVQAHYNSHYTTTPYDHPLLVALCSLDLFQGIIHPAYRCSIDGIRTHMKRLSGPPVLPLYYYQDTLYLDWNPRFKYITSNYFY